MNAQLFARTAYGRPETPIRSARQIEYDLFAKITQRLAQADQQRETHFPAFMKALHDNVQLWRVLATDVASSGNGLPQQLRARLFYLYQFTDQHSRKVMKHEASVEVLVDINKAIMRGLRGEGEQP